MKRFLAGFVTAAILFSVPLAIAETPIRLVVNGQEVSFPDAPPAIINGYTMVPARPLAEALGAEVKWDEANRTVVVTEESSIVETTPASAQEPIPSVVVIDGVRHYRIRTLRDFFSKVLHGRAIAIGHDTVWVDNQEYNTPDRVIDGDYLKAYKDLSALIEAGLITEQQLIEYYGA